MEGSGSKRRRGQGDQASLVPSSASAAALLLCLLLPAACDAAAGGVDPAATAAARGHRREQGPPRLKQAYEAARRLLENGAWAFLCDGALWWSGMCAPHDSGRWQ